MSQQTLAQTRVVDPILSEHARGYGTVWLENPSEAAMQLMGTEEIKV